MFQKQENNGSMETIVGASVKLKGNLKSEGDVRILGALNGEVQTKGHVYIGKDAEIVGKVKAGSVSVAGFINGSIEAKDKLEIESTGKVFGDIKTTILVIQEGGIFSGKSEMKVETLEEKEPEEEIEPEAEEQEIEAE